MRKSGLFLVLLCGFCFLSDLQAQRSSHDSLYCTEEDRAIVERYLTALDAGKNLPLGELITETALFFLGTPYVAGTLEKEPEGLVVNLREMDCTTLVENVLALARTLQSGNPSFDTFCRELQTIRYREGRITGYPDRLHYMSDWIWENARKGIVRDVTAEMPGMMPLPLHLSFISTHPAAYKQLKNRPDWVRQTEAKEKEINRRRYAYLPKTEIGRAEHDFQAGDIVCFVTTVPGLDVSHVGILYRTEEMLTFIHASTTAKKVVVNNVSAGGYMAGMKSNRGLMIARPLPPSGFQEIQEKE